MQTSRSSRVVGVWLLFPAVLCFISLASFGRNSLLHQGRVVFDAVLVKPRLLLDTGANKALSLQASGDLCGVPAFSAVTPNSKPALPPLFDLAGLPSADQTCAHCTPEDDREFCCGVCIFEGRTCEANHAGKNISQRVVSQLLSDGFHLGQLAPYDLFARIRGRTLWFLGDSQTWHFYLAVECFLHSFAVDYRRRNVTDEPQLRLRLRPVTKPKERYPQCLHLREGTRVCAVRADDAWSMTQDVLPTLRTLAGGNLSADLMVWNFGLHHPPTEEVYGVQLDHAAQYVQANKAWLPQLVWMDTPPQHFATPSGMFTNQLRAVPKPWRCGKMQYYDLPAIQQGGAFNLMARSRVPRLGRAHLATWGPTLPLHYAHVQKECTHFCHPGAYQLWTYLLAELLRREGLGTQLPGSLL